MRKIALLRWKCSNIGGGEKVAISLSNELSKYYKVYLISLGTDGIPFYPVSNEVNYVNLGGKKSRVRDGFLSNVFKLRNFLKSNNIEIILSIGVSSNLFMLLSTLFTNIKTVFCEHNNISYIPSKLHFIQRYLGAKFTTKMVTLTEQDSNDFIKKYKINPNRIEFIYNWIDEYDKNIIQYDLSSKRLISVGRFSKEKGYNLLCQVAGRLYEKYPEWSWDIYGGGDDVIKTELSLLPNIVLKGFVEGTENIFPNHAIYVMTSYYEGLPLVLLEAKQFQLPIVSFACPTGPAEIIRDEVNGFLVNDYNVDEMVDKISRLIEDNQLRSYFSKNAKLDIEKFSKKMIINKWLKLIEEL